VVLVSPADDALSLDEIDAAFASVYESLRGFDRWTIQQDIVLGIFDFTKFSLYSQISNAIDPKLSLIQSFKR